LRRVFSTARRESSFFFTTFSDVIAGKLKSMGGGIAAIPTLIATGVATADPGAAGFPPQGSKRCRQVATRRALAQLQRSWSWQKSPQENATARVDGWGRLLADRGLYCLPTGWSRELTEKIRATA
jgi:hypothetical protein